MKKHNLIENELIILTKQTIDVFLKQENPSDLISLYTFYYYTAKWQQTNQPKATSEYVKKGLSWGIDRFMKAKKTLIKLGLISNVKDIDKKTGMVKGWYVRLNYIIKKSTLPETTGVDYPQGGKQETNALSSNNINALNNSKKEILSIWNNGNNIKHKEFSDGWNSELTKLLKEHSLEEILKAIQTYTTILAGEEYRWSHKWTLYEFLKRKNGCRVFVHKEPNDYLKQDYERSAKTIDFRTL